MTEMAISLRDLDEKIAARERRLAQNRENLVYQVTVVEDFVAKAATDLAKHARGYAEAMESRAVALEKAAIGYRSEPSWHTSTLGAMLQSTEVTAAETMTGLLSTQIGLAEHQLRTACERLSNLRATLAESGGKADPVLMSLREQRDQLLARYERARDQRAPTPMAGAEADELTGVRSGTEQHGGAASAGRQCECCGGALPPGRRRFCSRRCQDRYAEALGTPVNARKDRHYDYSTYDPEDDLYERL